MSEPLPNCPACGSDETEASPHDLWGLVARCRLCDAVMPAVAWRRLARAVALLGACERLPLNPGTAYTLGMDEQGQHCLAYSIDATGAILAEVEAPTLPDALIALAQE